MRVGNAVVRFVLPCCERVGGDLRKGEEFVTFDGARVVLNMSVSRRPRLCSD